MNHINLYTLITLLSNPVCNSIIMRSMQTQSKSKSNKSSTVEDTNTSKDKPNTTEVSESKANVTHSVENKPSNSTSQGNEQGNSQSTTVESKPSTTQGNSQNMQREGASSQGIAGKPSNTEGTAQDSEEGKYSTTTITEGNMSANDKQVLENIRKFTIDSDTKVKSNTQRVVIEDDNNSNVSTRTNSLNSSAESLTTPEPVNNDRPRGTAFDQSNDGNHPYFQKKTNIDEITQSPEIAKPFLKGTIELPDTRDIPVNENKNPLTSILNNTWEYWNDKFHFSKPKSSSNESLIIDKSIAIDPNTTPMEVLVNIL